MNHYEILGIPRDATTEDIRRAFRRAAQRLHPDKNIRPGDTELFLDASVAYEVLSDPRRRAEYDAQLEAAIAKPAIESRIRVRVVHGRENLLAIDEPQMHYTLLEILPPEQTSGERAPINLCVLIDRSTSMRGERMDRVRRATTSILKSLKPDDAVSIVAFSDRAEVVVTPEQALSINIARARLSQIQAGGGTEIARALETGLAQVRSRSSPGSINHLILITDGRTYGDEENCMAMAAQAAADKITINTVGIGADWSDALLDEVARLSGGTTAYLNSPIALLDLMDRIHRSLSNVAALQVMVEAKMSSHTTLRSAFRLRPDPLPLGDMFPMSLGHLPGDDRICILFEWMLDPIMVPGEITLAELRISSGSVGTEEPSSQQALAIKMHAARGPQADPPAEDVLSAVGAVTLYRMQDRARLDAAAGRIPQAIQRLENLAAHLEAIGETNLANLARSEARNLKQTKHLSSEGEKDLKYGSRALLLLPPPVKR